MDLDIGDFTRVVLAFGLVLFVIAFSRYNRLFLEKDVFIASARAFLQLSILGFAIGIIFSLEGMLWVFLAFLVMLVTAAQISVKRSKGLPVNFTLTLFIISTASMVVVAAMMLLGVLESRPHVILPLGGMVIGNSMITNSLSMDRFRSELKMNIPRIEGALALGAAPGIAISDTSRESIRASMIPRIDSLKSMGIVWIPGLMSGMVLGGSDPLLAAQYQLIIMFMILTSAMLSSFISVTIVSRRIFTDAYQLIDMD